MDHPNRSACFTFLIAAVSLLQIVRASAQAPNSLTGKTIGVGITDGYYPFSSLGYYIILPAASGNSYQLIGIYGVGNSHGTYSYSQMDASTGTASFSDSLV